MSELERGLGGCMFVLSAHRVRRDWVFVLRSETGAEHRLRLGPLVSECSCEAGGPCRHIFFVLGRVLNMRRLCRETWFNPWCPELELRLQAVFERRGKVLREQIRKRARPEQACVICMQDCAEPYHCSQCLNALGHDKCVNAWYLKRWSCPLCRAGPSARHRRELHQTKKDPFVFFGGFIDSRKA